MMIRKRKIVATLVALMMIMTACSKDVVKAPAEVDVETSKSQTTTMEESKIHEVLDEHFDSFVSDVYSYPKDYEGLQYRLRAYYRQIEHDGLTKDYLLKGTDERWMGFEIDTTLELPPPGSLIVIEGTFKVRLEDDQNTPYLHVTHIEIIREKK